MSDIGAKLLVTGAAGMLGRAVVAEAERRGYRVTALGRAELDVTDGATVVDAIAAAAPGAVVNCAAYTDVDRAEAERDAAFAVNAAGARNVARACAAMGATCLQISTDYVFNGESDEAYPVGGEPDPVNVYGESKLAGEAGVREAGGAWLVVRTSWLYGAGGRNFVDAVVALGRERDRLEVVADQRSRPTWTGSLAPALLDLLSRGARGVHHAADRGAVSRYELAAAALKLAGLTTPVDPVPSSRFPLPARRPRSSVLDTHGTETILGRPFPDWRESLAAHLSGGAGAEAAS